MKRIFHWLDENLEEFLLVIGLIAMTLIMGADQIYFYLVRFFKRQLLQQKMPFHQDRAVCCDFPAERKSHLQNCESYV